MKTKLLTLLLFALCSVSFAQNFENGFYNFGGMPIYLESIGDKEYVLFSWKHRPVKAVEEKGMLKICTQTPCTYFKKTPTGMKLEVVVDEAETVFDLEKIPEFARGENNTPVYPYEIRRNCCGYLVAVELGKTPDYDPEVEGCDCQ
ncbi:MAG: hypothetical protein ACK5XP_07945 [Sphingobacteriia bacterium]